MDYSIVAILFSLLHVFNVGTAAPLPVEVEKAKVERMAKQLIVKLNKDFQVIFVVLSVATQSVHDTRFYKNWCLN